MPDQISGFTYREVQFTKGGTVHDPAEVTALLSTVQDEGTTDLIVVSHGWNNDMARARELYGDLFESVRSTLDSGSGGGLPGRKIAVAGVLWPSKKFADKELIPGGGAASFSGDLSEAELLAQIDSLADEIPAADWQRLHELLPDLEDRRSARREIGEIILRMLGDQSELDEESRQELPSELFDLEGDELIDRLGQPGALELHSAPTDGGAASLDAGGAAGLGDLFSGVRNGVRKMLNLTTYYKMKDRAGKVGIGGLFPLLGQLKQARPDMRLHLVGHSFGGRLVTAAVHGKDGEAAVPVSSLTLLQAAFSHNGFAQDFDGQRDGFFRRVVAEGRVQGPIAITHTVNDRAVGVSYPLASRLARQNAAGLGDANDPFGGIGRNGAQHTPEAQAGTLLPPSQAGYAFAAGKVFNLKADDHISDHSDVAGHAVAHALLSVIAAT